MFDYNEELQERKVDMAEVYRQNYMDALDEIRNLRTNLADIEAENILLNRDIDRAENHIYHKEDPEMEKLMRGLKEMEIPFTWRPLHGGEQIICEGWDAVCHSFSYGGEDGLIEIMGSIVDSEIDDDVEGYLTAEDILKRL